MQFLENIDIKSQKDAVSHLGAQAARRHTGIDNAANVSPTDKTPVHSFRVSGGVRPLTCCWQLTNSRVSLGRPRAPHKRAGGISSSNNVSTTLCSKSDGQASDDGNVKTLTVSIDAPKQLPLQSPIRPKSLVHRIYMYSPGAAVALVPSTDSTCERAGDINAPLECGLLILIACSSERAWVNSEGLE